MTGTRTHGTETLEESLAQRPNNLGELSKCRGKTVQIEYDRDQGIVVYAGNISDCHLFVSQRPDGSGRIIEYACLGHEIFFKEGRLYLGENYQYNDIRPRHERYAAHRALIEESGLWKN